MKTDKPKTIEWVSLFISIFVLVAIFTQGLIMYGQLKVMEKQAKDTMRPWVAVAQVETNFMKDGLDGAIDGFEGAIVVRNDGSIPALCRIHNQLSIGDTTEEGATPENMKAVLGKGVEARSRFEVPGENFKKVISGEVELKLRIEINYGTSDKKLNEYQTFELWRFNKDTYNKIRAICIKTGESVKDSPFEKIDGNMR